MALKLQNGEEYLAARVRSGASLKGPWELIVVREGRHEITIFPINKPTGVKEGGTFEVKEITSVQLRYGKDKQGNWGRQNINVEAVVEAKEDPDIDLLGLNDLDLDL